MGREPGVPATLPKVLAIGGGASVGKTTLAAALAARLGGAAVSHVDDDLVPAVDPGGPAFLATPDVWRRPGGWLCDQLVGWTALLHPGIDGVVARLAGDVAEGRALGALVEGEGVEPRHSRTWDPQVARAVVVVEEDARVLARTLATQPGADRFLALSRVERQGVVDMNVRYGRWLRREAERAGEPWAPARPWSSLPARVLGALVGTPPRRG